MINIVPLRGDVSWYHLFAHPDQLFGGGKLTSQDGVFQNCQKLNHLASEKNYNKN